MCHEPDRAPATTQPGVCRGPISADGRSGRGPGHGDALATLPGCLDDLPDGEPVVVMNSFAFAQFPRRGGRRSKTSRIGPGLDDGCTGCSWRSSMTGTIGPAWSSTTGQAREKWERPIPTESGSSCPDVSPAIRGRKRGSCFLPPQEGAPPQAGGGQGDRATKEDLVGPALRDDRAPAFEAAWRRRRWASAQVRPPCVTRYDPLRAASFRI